MPEKNVMKITVVVNPAVSGIPKKCCRKYQIPRIKPIPEIIIPNIDIMFKGLLENPTNPFNPIRKEPKNLL